MAKKVVATLKDTSTSKAFAKVILTVRSPKTGAYTFKEEIIPLDDVKDLLAKNQ